MILLDILEITVGADLQFRGRGFVAYDDPVGVYLHGRDRADVRVRAFHTLLQGAGFLMPEGEDQHLLRIEHRGDTYRHGLLGNLVHVVVEETRVYDQRVVGQRLDAGARVERRERFVEGQMAVFADTGTCLIVVANAMRMLRMKPRLDRMAEEARRAA